MIVCSEDLKGTRTYQTATTGWIVTNTATASYDAMIRGKELGFWADIGRTIERQLGKLLGYKDK